MNIWGKVLAILVVIAALVASILTSKLVQYRNSYTAKAAAAKAKYLDAKPKIETLEAQIDSLRGEIFRALELWGTAAPNVQTIVNPADGTAQIGVGAPAIRPGMVLHGFELDQNAAAIYRGSFLVVDAQNDNSTLKPNFRVTADDVKSWKGGPWRWRNALPSAYQETFDRQLLAIVKDEEILRARMANLDAQKAMLEKANASLKQRETELLGGEGLSTADSVGPEFREGLVAALEQIEEDRNQILLKVDELRRKVREVYADIERVHSENVELIEKLPEPTPRGEVTQKK